MKFKIKILSLIGLTCFWNIAIEQESKLYQLIISLYRLFLNVKIVK